MDGGARKYLLLGTLFGILAGYVVISPLALMAVISLFNLPKASFQTLYLFSPRFLHWSLFFIFLGGCAGLVGGMYKKKLGEVRLWQERELAERKRMEDLLSRERDRILRIASNLPCGLAVINAQYEIEFMNSYMMSTFGSAVGSRCYEIFRNRNTPCEECPSQRAIKSLKLETAELKRADGREIELVSTPLQNPDGTYSAVELIQDVTERKRLAERLEQLAMTDGLTGLYNRRQLNITLPFEIARAQRQAHALSILFFDIDSFKLFNDRYGHQRGDEVLQKTGGIVKKSIRDYVDSAYRYGGEEFVVILPEVMAKQAKEIGERIRTAFKAIKFDHLSISVGVVEYQQGWDSPALMRHADSAMYKAKGLGRDRVYIYGT